MKFKVRLYGLILFAASFISGGYLIAQKIDNKAGGARSALTSHRFIDSDGDGVCDNYLDANGDGKCDVNPERKGTGCGQGKGRLQGTGERCGAGQGRNFRYIDANNDGVCDNYADSTNIGNRTACPNGRGGRMGGGCGRNHK